MLSSIAIKDKLNHLYLDERSIDNNNYAFNKFLKKIDILQLVEKSFQFQYWKIFAPNGPYVLEFTLEKELYTYKAIENLDITLPNRKK